VASVNLSKTSDLDSIARDVLTRLIEGEVVLLPTETQYGLFCRADSPAALTRMFEIKERDTYSPVALAVSDAAHALQIVQPLSAPAMRLVKRFWPGPLTIVAKSKVPSWPMIVSEFMKVGLRCSSHRLIKSLAECADFYLAQTSANIHGQDPTGEIDVLTNWLADKVPVLIFDSHVNPVGTPSTVVDVSGPDIKVLRAGRIDTDEILRVWTEETPS
jgi:L-threonylcarbamoyladenylate synthase